MFLKGLLAYYEYARWNERAGKTKEWRQQYLHQWEYGKYVTRIPNVVSYEIYEWRILQ